MEVDKRSDQKSDSYPHGMAAHGRLKNEFREKEKCDNLMSWLRWFCFLQTCEIWKKGRWFIHQCYCIFSWRFSRIWNGYTSFRWPFCKWIFAFKIFTFIRCQNPAIIWILRTTNFQLSQASKETRRGMCKIILKTCSFHHKLYSHL